MNLFFGNGGYKFIEVIFVFVSEIYKDIRNELSSWFLPPMSAIAGIIY